MNERETLGVLVHSILYWVILLAMRQQLDPWVAIARVGIITFTGSSIGGLIAMHWIRRQHH